MTKDGLKGLWACCRRSRGGCVPRAQQRPPGSAWDKCLYAQGTAQHRRIDTDLLNQMDPAASAKGSSVMNKVWRLCNGWLMDAKCANGSTTILYVGCRKTPTIVGVDFPQS